MKRIFLISTVILLSLLALPQQVAAQQPPEAQSMSVFVGDWEYNDLDGAVNCKWLGDLILHCRGSVTNDEGITTESVFMMRYDPEAKIYTTSRFYSGGYTDSGLGWVDGDTWFWVYEGSVGARYRVTMVISEDNWTYEWHNSVKGGAWEPSASGSAKKVK